MQNWCRVIAGFVSLLMKQAYLRCRLRCCKLITKLEMRAAAHFMQPDAKINQDSDFLQIRVYIKVNQKLNILLFIRTIRKGGHWNFLQQQNKNFTKYWCLLSVKRLLKVEIRWSTVCTLYGFTIKAHQWATIPQIEFTEYLNGNIARLLQHCFCKSITLSHKRFNATGFCACTIYFRLIMTKLFRES